MDRTPQRTPGRTRPSRGVVVRSVAGGSHAARCLRSGDRLLAINGSPVRDELDLVFLSADERLDIAYSRADEAQGGVARIRSAHVAKPFDAPLGIEIAPLRPRRCRNHCIFCFIDQNPPGLRPSLYVKDEDLRLSFTHGHYVTTTSFTSEDLERIAAQRLSPLYISVHATNPALRKRMLGLAADADVPEITETLRRLARAHIELHTQIVLCPGWNDGAELDRTLDDLESLQDALLSVAIVPVGLTAHRAGLEALRLLSPEGARVAIAQVERRQERFLAERGERIVLLADEIYLMADAQPPDYSEDEIACQIENGVGMLADFLEGWPEAAARLPERITKPARVALLTSALGARALEPLRAALSSVAGLDVSVLALENSLYGASVTVSGLLSGADFDRALAGLSGVDLAILPANALRCEDERFLDGLTLEALRERHGALRIEAFDGRAIDLAERILVAAER